jgi:hypothetical protein
MKSGKGIYNYSFFVKFPKWDAWKDYDFSNLVTIRGGQEPEKLSWLLAFGSWPVVIG